MWTLAIPLCVVLLALLSVALICRSAFRARWRTDENNVLAVKKTKGDLENASAYRVYSMRVH